MIQKLVRRIASLMDVFDCGKLCFISFIHRFYIMVSRMCLIYKNSVNTYISFKVVMFQSFICVRDQFQIDFNEFF